MLLTNLLLLFFHLLGVVLMFLPTVFAAPPRVPVFYHRHKVGYKYSPYNEQLFTSAARRVENNLPAFNLTIHKYFTGPDGTPKPADLLHGVPEFLDDHYQFRKLWEQSVQDRKTMKDHIFLFNHSKTANGVMDDQAAATLTNMVKEFTHLRNKVNAVYSFAHQCLQVNMWVPDETFYEEVRKYVLKGDGPWWNKKLSTDAYILEQQLKHLQTVKKEKAVKYWDTLVELAVNRKRATTFKEYHV